MRIFERCYRIINKYNQKTQKPRCYGTDDKLYASQVHMLDVIGAYEGITTTQLANLLGITKGAVSQTTNKLFNMSLINKLPSSERKNEVHISLTDKGRTVFDYHNELHISTQRQIDSIFSSLPPDSLAAVNSIIDLIEEMIEKV